jgi:hypothetical protein
MVYGITLVWWLHSWWLPMVKCAMNSNLIMIIMLWIVIVWMDGWMD